MNNHILRKPNDKKPLFILNPAYLSFPVIFTDEIRLENPLTLQWEIPCRAGSFVPDGCRVVFVELSAIGLLRLYDATCSRFRLFAP